MFPKKKGSQTKDSPLNKHVTNEREDKCEIVGGLQEEKVGETRGRWHKHGRGMWITRGQQAWAYMHMAGTQWGGGHMGLGGPKILIPMHMCNIHGEKESFIV